MRRRSVYNTKTGAARTPGRGGDLDLLNTYLKDEPGERSVYIQTVSEGVPPGHGMDSCNTPT